MSEWPSKEKYICYGHPYFWESCSNCVQIDFAVLVLPLVIPGPTVWGAGPNWEQFRSAQVLQNWARVPIRSNWSTWLKAVLQTLHCFTDITSLSYNIIWNILASNEASINTGDVCVLLLLLLLLFSAVICGSREKVDLLLSGIGRACVIRMPRYNAVDVLFSPFSNIYFIPMEIFLKWLICQLKVILC